MDRTYVFDLDGTITVEESLPRLAKEVGPDAGFVMDELTKRTVRGEVDFEKSFRQRVDMLKEIPIYRARIVMSQLVLDPHIYEFIRRNKKYCIIVTCNLDTWVAPIAQKLGCQVFSSKAIVEDGMITGVESVLNKDAVMQMISTYYPNVVGVGDSYNDIPILKYADVGIAYGGVHKPPKELLVHADYVETSGAKLVEVLENI